MFKINALVCFAAASFIFAPSLAHADGAAPSYAMKKQGRVPFIAAPSKEDQSKQDQQQTENQQDPAQVEPAAGAEETQGEEIQKPSALQEQMKLPRKN